MADISRRVEGLAELVTSWAGSTSGFATAAIIVVVWGCLGPIFGFSDTWQLVINTGTTIVTFLMVFLIQRTQNKDALAIHLKLNELVAALEGASNRLVDVEALDENELRILREHYRQLAEMARHDRDVAQSHSIDEAKRRHASKAGARQNSTPAAGR
jgi:low affinity Fe/Cu permease